MVIFGDNFVNFIIDDLRDMVVYKFKVRVMVYWYDLFKVVVLDL